MFLFRIMFWMVVVILILPAEDPAAGGADTGQAVTVTRAVGAAKATVSDMAGFCARNRDVCETGTAVWSTFWAKARHGAGMVAEIVSGADGTAGPADTLTTDDLEPAWRGPDAGDA
jgi:hypothetical protein